MKGRDRGKRRAAWLRFSCFSHPTEQDSPDSDERYKTGSKIKNSKIRAKRAILKGEQGPPRLSRDSQTRLEAYLGKGQQGCVHGASDSVLSQAAHTAATERRLKGLLDDQVPCSGAAEPCQSSQVDSVVVGSSSGASAAKSSSSYSFEGCNSSEDAQMESKSLQNAQEEDNAQLSPTKQAAETVSVPSTTGDGQLHAAPATPSKPLNRVSGSISPPDDSETSKTSLVHDATPTASDSERSQDSVLLAERPTSASAPLHLSAPGYPNPLIPTPFDSIFANTRALHPSVSSHSLISAAESMFTEGSVKLEALAPAPSHHTAIRTIPITLSSTTLDAVAHSVDGDAVSVASTGQFPRSQQHQRSKTMPHMHSNSQDFSLIDDKASVDGGASVKSTTSRRHTAIVLLSTSEDENEEEEEEPKGAGAAAVASSSVISSRGSRTMRRRLSEVYEGHHIPLQKLRKQMGNPEGKN